VGSLGRKGVEKEKGKLYFNYKKGEGKRATCILSIERQI